MTQAQLDRQAVALESAKGCLVSIQANTVGRGELMTDEQVGELHRLCEELLKFQEWVVWGRKG